MNLPERSSEQDNKAKVPRAKKFALNAQAQILAALRAKSPQSMADLVATTGLKPATVKNEVSRLCYKSQISKVKVPHRHYPNVGGIAFTPVIK
jgi:DNA-binding MarR family transcriptional regulator